tara:strand:- start:8077 stop:8940 length:864 start_codon:yes stop_codon:yes gene_type:complete
MSHITCQEAAENAGLKKTDIEFLLSISKRAVTIGGKVLMDHYGSLEKIKNKGRIGDLVTEADLHAEEEVTKLLKRETSQISILAEESGYHGSENSLVWCLDPLDGTTNYANGYPFFGTSLGLNWNNKPILGSISIPFLKETYWAGPGIGSFCNDTKNIVSNKTKLEDCLLVTGFSYDRHSVLDNNYAEFCWMTHRTRGVRRGGAAAIDLAFVANGRLDGYWERGLAKWDLSAGVPIVELAGGEISDYQDKSFDINTGRILANTPGITEALKNELKKVSPLPAKYYGV